MKHFKILIPSTLSHLVLSILIFQSFMFADVPHGKKVNNSIKNIQSMMAESSYNFSSRDMDGWITNNGLVLDYHPIGDSALKFKEVSAVFQASVWAAGKVDGQLRVIVGDYTQDMGPGSWGQNSLDESYKIYYVDTSMFSSPGSHDDFQSWPVNQGAPYVDVNGNGIYEPLPTGDDYPKFIGDKLAFFVANDGDPAYKINMSTAPMNLEMQFLIYSFDQPVSEYLAQSLFYKVLVINKGSDVIEDTYFGVFFDDDLGSASDDFVGVSVDRGLGYVWNDGPDASMDGLIQPFSKGSDFLQGPMIDCISGGAVSFNLSASDGDGDTLVYQVDTNPSNGSINCNSASGSCTYTPTSGYTGSDSFTYYVYESDDSSRQSNTATVTINIQAARGEIGIDNLMITSASKKGFLPHPNSPELVTAMTEIKFDEHDHRHDGFVRCASDELEKELQLINPEFIKKRDEFLDIVKQNEERFRTEKRTTVEIPVIFHVLYSNNADNISNSQIAQNFDQLNDDFKLENADKDSIPSIANKSDAPSDPSIDYSHHDVRGTHDINFIGFDGETKGSGLNEGTTIRRYNISQSSVSGVSEASTLASSTATDSGVDGGYQEGYLNIYIAPLTGGLLGQAYLGFPEAVVLGSTVGSLDSPGTAGGYNRGRTLTHEIGHNFTYNHVFNSSNCSQQEWSDIPAQTVNNRDAEVYNYSVSQYTQPSFVGNGTRKISPDNANDTTSLLYFFQEGISDSSYNEYERDLLFFGSSGKRDGSSTRYDLWVYNASINDPHFLYDVYGENSDRIINEFNLSIDDTTTYATTESLDSDKLYFVTVEGTGELDGEDVDIAYQFDSSITAINILQMDGENVRPRKDVLNSSDHYYHYYFLGKDAPLSFKFNTDGYSSKSGSFYIVVGEVTNEESNSINDVIKTTSFGSQDGYLISGGATLNTKSRVQYDIFNNPVTNDVGGPFARQRLSKGYMLKLKSDLSVDWVTYAPTDLTYSDNPSYSETSSLGTSIFESVLKTDGSEGFISIGYRNVDISGERYGYGIALELDKSGNIVADRELLGGLEQFPYLEDIMIDSQGDILIVGNNGGGDTEANEAIIMKYDSDFNEVFNITLESPSSGYFSQRISSILENDNGEYIVTGYVDGDDEYYSAYKTHIAKISSSGNVIWNKIIFPPDTDGFYRRFDKIIKEKYSIDSDGIPTGQVNDMGTFLLKSEGIKTDINSIHYSDYIIRINNDGDVLNSYTYDMANTDHGRSTGIGIDEGVYNSTSGYYRLPGYKRTLTNNEYYSSYKSDGTWYSLQFATNTNNEYLGGKDAENSCISTSGKGDQFMNYMDYVYDDQMRMFSAEQALDGYSWAFSYDWFNDTSSLPVANNVTFDATVNEECTEGAKMFGQRHPGKKNLQMTSFSFFINGDATYTDPADETEAYNYMQGLRKDGSAYPVELAGDLYDQKFNFYGDPTGSEAHSSANPIDGNYAASDDRRSLMNVGPFTMAPGDSQEVVFNVMMASGTDALDALSNLFTANDSTQVWYDNDFEILEETNEVRNIKVSATATEGFAPLTSTFSLNSTYQFPAYNWDFDNDGTIDSKSLNPTHTFTEAGTYVVSAKAFYNFYENGTFFMQESIDSVTVTVLDNTAITITADSLTTNEDVSLSSTLSISNPSNRSFELQVGLSPSNGMVSFNNKTINYTPNNNFNGLDSLKVFAKDGSYESNEALIKINVLPVDDTPVTADVSVSTNEDTAVAVYLTASEYDGDTYEFEIKENPAYGSLSSILSSAGVDSVIYTPDADWFGTDQFKFEASDSSSRMNLGTAVIQVLPVNDAPITEDMTVETYEDVTTPISLPFSDIDDDQISISATSPSHGSIEINNSYVEYIPDTNYFGDDAFTYYVNDGELDSNTSTISIALGPVNDASSEFTVSEEYTVNSSTGDEWVITTNNLIATPQNEQDSLQFNWEESFDIDGDKIQYRMIGYDALEFLTMDSWITDLTLSWSIKDLVSYTDTVNVASGSWIIVATDGEFFKESNFGNPMELFINGSALVPDAYTLNQNYPNPFSSSTTITYDMPETQKVMIRIFDIKGRLIRTLANEDQNAGFKTVIWDGKNDDGDNVSAGMYFYQMHAPSSLNFNGLTTTKKMIKLD